MYTFNGVAIYTKLKLTTILTMLLNCDVSAHRFIQVNIQNLVIINAYIHQGQRTGSTVYHDKLTFLTNLLHHITNL